MRIPRSTPEGALYVQRVDTSMGKAPTTDCAADAVDRKIRVDSVVDDYFYAKPREAQRACRPALNGNPGVAAA